jgi:hypothetical protein
MERDCQRNSKAQGLEKRTVDLWKNVGTGKDRKTDGG